MLKAKFPNYTGVEELTFTTAQVKDLISLGLVSTEVYIPIHQQNTYLKTFFSLPVEVLHIKGEISANVKVENKRTNEAM